MNNKLNLRLLAGGPLLAGLCVLAACSGGKTPPTASEPVASSAPPVAADVSAPKAEQAPADGGAPVSVQLATIDGGTFDTAQHRGHWVVVNFWATWCHPCLAEMPQLSQMDQQRDDIDVVGLAFDDIAPADLKTFVSKHPVSYPIVKLDPFAAPPKPFETPAGLPTTYLLDPQGKIAKRFVGPVTPHDIEQIVDAGKGGGMR